MSKRVAVYARFSSDRQNERSCADQIALCEAWAERQGLAVTATYEDAAVSGASTINRSGLSGMMRDARAKRFDVVLCEALDRLSRDQADLAALKKQLSFLGIAIMTVQDGEVGAMHIGLKGLMSEMFLADLAQKTHRGQAARVRDGAIGGGRSFGYAPVPGQPGALSIIEHEAAIVRRIFADYAAGKSPRDIAAALNVELVPAPRGGRWNASTIIGSRKRQNGLLQNSLYVGTIVWNRQRFIKDPATGKRVSRPNPESEWVSVAAPELAIVDAASFAAAAGRRSERSVAHAEHRSNRPRHVLSGLMKCGCCGASYTILGRDRMGCAGYRERGDCTNNRTVERRHVEARVLTALHDHLASPELISEYVRAYHESYRQQAAADRKDRMQLQRRFGEVSRQIEAIVDRILAGTVTPAIEARLPALEQEKADLLQRLAQLDADDLPIALHPAAAQKYARLVADLREKLDAVEEASNKAALLDQVRKLIGKVTITPGANNKEPVNLVVHGLLAELLVSDDGALQYRGALVAGAGFEPATFRL